MKTYALVIGGLVQSHFSTDRSPSDFPDIEANLVEAPDDVQDGMLFDGKTFSAVSEAVPQLVTMRQARLALLGAGLLDSVNAAVAAMTGVQGKAAQIEWEFSSEVQRTRPLVVGLGQALGLSEAQLDALFVAASKL